MHIQYWRACEGPLCGAAHLSVRFPELQLRHHELCVLVILRLKLVALRMVAAQLCMLTAATLQLHSS